MFWSIVIFFICLFFSFQISTLPYSNPYTLTMIFGKKGSGKTTTMVIPLLRIGFILQGILLLRSPSAGKAHNTAVWRRFFVH